MTHVPQGPADTRLMGIVHDALRRDLRRAIAALSSTPCPEPARRRAIADHVGWMMGFVQAHHDGEDAGLWPLVRGRDESAASLLDAMAADHARIAPWVEACGRAARDYHDEASDEVRLALHDALDHLGEVLLPHLQREEDEMMPLVSVAITPAEWRAVDQKYFIEPKSSRELGLEGHWLLDGLDAERRQIVVHEVPPIRRFVLVHGFARRYRRRAEACWGRAARRTAYGPAAALPRRIPRTGRVESFAPVPIEAVWAVVSDVTRVGEWSHECRQVEWLDGAREAAPGVRFRGTNKAGPWKWSRVNEVVVADPPRTFVWRTVPTFLYPDSTEWRIELESVDGGTRVAQSFELLRAPALLARLYALAIPSHRGRATGLTDDLRRLGERAAQQAPAGAGRDGGAPGGA